MKQRSEQYKVKSVGLFCEVGAKNIEFDLQRDSEFFAYLTVVDAVVKLQLFSLVWNLVHSSFKFFWLTFHEESSPGGRFLTCLWTSTRQD